MNGLLIGFIGVPPLEAEIIVTLAIGPVTRMNRVTSDERAGPGFLFWYWTPAYAGEQRRG